MQNIKMDDLSLINSDNSEIISQYFKMTLVYEFAIDIVKTKLQILSKEYDTLKGYNPIHNLETRVKSPKSIIEKLKKRSLEINTTSVKRNLKDVAGVRIICNYIEDVYVVADVLKSQDMELIEIKDYIKNPKPNGYRSLHLVFLVTVRLGKETERVPVEIQIRTIAMDFWASLEHELRYKKDQKMSSLISLKLKACAEMSNRLDIEMEKINKLLQETK